MEVSKFRREFALMQINHEGEIAEIKQQHLKTIAHIEADIERKSYEKIVAEQLETEIGIDDLRSFYEQRINDVIETEGANHDSILLSIHSRYEKNVAHQAERHWRAISAIQEKHTDEIDQFLELSEEEREDQIERVRLEYEKRLERQGDRYQHVISREQVAQQKLFEDVLPNIELVRDSSDKLVSSNVRRSIFAVLKNLNNRPQEVRGERVKMTEWLELRPAKKHRVYYRRAQGSKRYLVLVGDNKNQSRDIDWMRGN